MAMPCRGDLAHERGGSPSQRRLHPHLRDVDRLLTVDRPDHHPDSRWDLDLRHSLVRDAFRPCGQATRVVLGAHRHRGVPYPAFYLINLGNTTSFFIAIAFFSVLLLPAVTAVAPVYATELFPTDVRYTAVSTSYQLGQILGAGIAPVAAASLLAASGGGTDTSLISVYLVVLCVIGIAALAGPRSSRSDPAIQPCRRRAVGRSVA
jgi:hypothetical protein